MLDGSIQWTTQLNQTNTVAFAAVTVLTMTTHRRRHRRGG